MKKHGGNVFAFAKNNKIAIEEIIDFSANINPLGMVPGLKEHLLSHNEDWINYPDPDYVDLKAAIADFENVHQEQIIVGNGAIECLFLVAEAIKAKRVLIQAPTFIEYERAFYKSGSQIDLYHLNHENFKANLKDIDLKYYDAIVICNPNNPTGILNEKQDLIELLDRSIHESTYIIIDEAFIDFLENESDYSLVDQLNNYPNLIILKSLTKFFAIPGLRLGYALTSSKEMLDLVAENRIPWTVNGLASKAGQYCLAFDHYIEETKAFIHTERKRLMALLSQINYINLYDSQVNYIFFKSNMIDLEERLIKYGIMIRNCSNYENLSEGYYRIAVKSVRDNNRLVEALKEIEMKRL